MISCRTVLFLALSLLAGCRSFQPAGAVGHDLLDNPGRSAFIRAPAGLGAILGHAVAVPFGVLLFPTVFFESAVVEGCDQLDPAEGGRGDERRNDLEISLVQAAFEYSSGVGAAVIGQPFEWIASSTREPPGPAPGRVRESPEEPPGTAAASSKFAVRPPSRQ